MEDSFWEKYYDLPLLEVMSQLTTSRHISEIHCFHNHRKLSAKCSCYKGHYAYVLETHDWLALCVVGRGKEETGRWNGWVAKKENQFGSAQA